MSTGPTTSRSDHRLQDEQRFAVLRRLLHGNDIGLRERFAGSVLLLYAQPLTRIAKRRTSDSMTADGGETAITVARGAIVCRSRSPRSRSYTNVNKHMPRPGPASGSPGSATAPPSAGRSAGSVAWVSRRDAALSGECRVAWNAAVRHMRGRPRAGGRKR